MLDSLKKKWDELKQVTRTKKQQEAEARLWKVFEIRPYGTPSAQRMITEAIENAKKYGVLDVHNVDGETLLMFAARHVRADIVDKLVDAGASVTGAPYVDGTPLISLALSNGDSIYPKDDMRHIVKTLVRAGTDLDAQDVSGMTALMYAAYGYHRAPDPINAHSGPTPELMQALIEQGANVDIQNKDGMTALMHAAEHGEVEAVKILLDAHARIDLKDKNGKTVKDYVQNSSECPDWVKQRILDMLDKASGCQKGSQSQAEDKHPQTEQKANHKGPTFKQALESLETEHSIVDNAHKDSVSISVGTIKKGTGR